MSLHDDNDDQRTEVSVPPQTDGSSGDSRAEGTDETVKKALDTAAELKQEGNEYFKSQDWNAALATYRSALGRLPKRPAQPDPATQGKGKEREVDDEEDVPTDAEPAEPAQPADAAPLPTFSTELQEACGKARAVLNANIAACYVKLGEHKEAVAACTQALLDDPNYIKALQRRASSNEELNTWSSLTSAQEDYTKLLDLLPSGSPQLSETRRKLQALKPRVEAAQKRETDEMIGKLKELGNSILGNFGLSTDNFKFEPNGQGGYSMNFVR